jgi:curved DNA-binding protein CbpA
MTLYEVLGVPEDATPDAIKKTYLARARALHPDHNRDPRAEEAMKMVNAAYDVLRDPVKKAQYDGMLARQRRPVMPVMPAMGPGFVVVVSTSNTFNSANSSTTGSWYTYSF